MNTRVIKETSFSNIITAITTITIITITMIITIINIIMIIIINNLITIIIIVMNFVWFLSPLSFLGSGLAGLRLQAPGNCATGEEKVNIRIGMESYLILRLGFRV